MCRAGTELVPLSITGLNLIASLLSHTIAAVEPNLPDPASLRDGTAVFDNRQP